MRIDIFDCMRYLLVLGLCLLLSCRKDEVNYELRNSYYQNITAGKKYDTALTVMTFNIQCGFLPGPSPWNKDQLGGTSVHIDQLAHFIDSTGADVVALQEVPLDRTNTVIKRLLDTLAHRLNMNYAFGAHGYNDAYVSGYPVLGQWGCAVMSRYPIEEIENREVSYLDVWTRRSTLRARLKLDAGRMIDVYSLHHKPMQDFSDLQKTAAFVHELDLPTIVCGDFNAGPDQVTGYLGLQLALPPHLSGIDLIYHSHQFQATDAYAAETLRLSDHAPVWVRLKY